MIRLALIIMVALQAAVGAAADTVMYAARREALMKKLDGAAAVLQGAPSPRAYVPFRQDNNFYYLTGVDVPNALLLLDALHHRSILFLPPRDKEAELWEGKVLAPGSEARNQTGLDEVRPLAHFEDELDKRKQTLHAVYISNAPYETAATSRDRALQYDEDQRDDPWDGRASRESAFENNLRAKLGSAVIIKDLTPLLDDMRRVKDAGEIEIMRKSGKIAALGVKEAMRSARPDLYEYQLAALAQAVSLWHGASGYAFFPTVGSGPNSCILHYSKNRRKMASGDIVVMDFGADFEYYGSDITRTFPASGKFSEEQAKVYRAVLAAQKAAIENVRPGRTFDDIEDAIHTVLARFGYDGHLNHGLIHPAGMAVHDAGKSRFLEPGMAVAIEPGVYFPDKNLGVRIEDTVLVTKEGNEVLTGNAPKTIEEIEKLMAERSLWEEIWP